MSVANRDQNDYKQYPYEGITTLWQCFERQVKKNPDSNFLGSRDPQREGKPYVWKTFNEINDYVFNLARGYVELGLMPEIEAEGSSKRFMGVYSKNREEWLVSDLASMCQSGTTIAFYDTLGPSAVEYIVNQTKLTTISCQESVIRTLIMLKTQNRIKSLENIISFDYFNSDIKEDAISAGLKIHHILEVVSAGRNSKLSKADLVAP